MVGLEAGQSAFGDVLAWFRDVLLSPMDELILTSSHLVAEQKENLLTEIREKLISSLTEKAEAIPLLENAPIALDWINGRRTPDADQSLSVPKRDQFSTFIIACKN